MLEKIKALLAEELGVNADEITGWTSVESLDSVQAHRALTIPAISALYAILLLASFVAIYYQSKRIMITDLQGNNDQ